MRAELKLEAMQRMTLYLPSLVGRPNSSEGSALSAFDEALHLLQSPE